MRDFDYEWLSNKKWDNEIVNLVAKIREYKGRQDIFIRQKPKELTRLVEFAKIQSIGASNRIEGIATTRARLEQLFHEKTTPKNRDENEIIGYRDVLNTIHESHDYIPIKPSYILQLHRDLMKGAGVSFAGKFKNVQNYIVEIRNGRAITRFTPLPPYETPDAIEAICEAYERVRATEMVDILLVIPAFICDFLRIHPFNDGNGRMSRLLTLLLLYQNGFEVGKYISIEKRIEDTKEYYYDALEVSDIGWHKGENNVTPFVKYMLRVILACYIDFEDRVNILNDNGVRSVAYDIVKRYVENKLGKFTSNDVIMNCPSIRKSSVLNALKTLLERGMISRHGKGRSVYYSRTT